VFQRESSLELNWLQRITFANDLRGRGYFYFESMRILYAQVLAFDLKFVKQGYVKEWN